MPEIINSDRWISLQEVCGYRGVKHHTILRWVEQTAGIYDEWEVME